MVSRVEMREFEALQDTRFRILEVSTNAMVANAIQVLRSSVQSIVKVGWTEANAAFTVKQSRVGVLVETMKRDMRATGQEGLQEVAVKINLLDANAAAQYSSTPSLTTCSRTSSSA